MKKIALMLTVLIMFSFSVAAFALETRSPSTDYGMYFSGSTVNCFAETVGDSDEDISITMKLYENGSRIRTWSDADTTYLYVSGSAPANKGDVYKLTVQVTIDGVQQPMMIINKEYR